MANQDIYPYGQGGVMPAGYPLTSSLDENNSRKGASAAAVYKLKRMTGGMTKVVVAASNTPEEMKSAAKYVCDGVNDEYELNAAIAECLNDKKELLLLRGDYYLDVPTKTDESSNDTFLLIDTSPVAGSTASGGLVMCGENPVNRAEIHISNAGYEALSSNKQYKLISVKDTTNYGGFVVFRNIRFRYPWNQKKICCLDFYNYGGNAMLHSIGCVAYTSGYNGQTVTISSPPPAAVDGCIGVRFIAKGPSGIYGNEITDSSVSGFNEGWSINTEWCLCNHVGTNFCVTGWVFGKYTHKVSGQYTARIHPIVLLNCSDERGVNLPVFYACDENQNIEMHAFSLERTEGIVPGGQLGYLARVISTGAKGEFRGIIHYSVQHHEEGGKNSVSVGFWEFGHGHGMRTTNMAHKQAGTTTERNTYRPNYMQRYFDTTLNKEIICVDESGNNGKGTWKDTMGNTV